MVTKEAVLEVLRTINDPEMPISIVDLGLVEDVRIDSGATMEESTVVIELLPTFVGCPALHAIEEEVERQVRSLPGVTQVVVHFRFAPPWTVDRISPSGREALRRFGVTVPGETTTSLPQCPFCGSSNIHLESSFGPTRCRMIYHCSSCRHSFEHMKRVSLRLHS